jgi:mannose-6-phosphate isomerase-like protein (cupin superfamily)
MKLLHRQPGSVNLMKSQTPLFTAVLTLERGYREEEFEWHENHDHLFQIIEGATMYEIGGSPRNGRRTGPGEWRAPDSKGAISVPLKKGDILLIPRGTPHRQTTLEMVSFMLISPVAS